MPSYLHESLLVLFRNRSTSAAELLSKLDIQLPEYDEVRTESADVGDLKPAEFRADLVLFLISQSKKTLGVIVEVQLGRDEDKVYAWPAYVANLRARHRCPVCLLVITIEEAVARWAGKTIDVGPGTSCRPWVIGPSNTPPITVLRQATENVELAVLSAVEHGRNVDRELAARVISTAVVASADIDAERSKLYLGLLLFAIGLNAPEMIEDTMKDSLGSEHLSDFVRRHVALGLAEGRMEGRIKGRTEGRRELVLKLLERRFGSLSDAVQTRVRDVQDSQLEEIAELMFTAQSPEQVLAALD